MRERTVHVGSMAVREDAESVWDKDGMWCGSQAMRGEVGGGMALLPRMMWAWPFQLLNALTTLGRVLWEECSREPPTQVRGEALAGDC